MAHISAPGWACVGRGVTDRDSTDPVAERDINDVVYKTATRKIEFNKNCWGPNKYCVFARNAEKTQWRHVADAESFEEAKTICNDHTRMEFADLALTEVERMARVVSRGR